MRYVRLLVVANLAALAMSVATPSSGQSDRPRVERFTIDIPAAVLSDLDERLARTRWPDQLPGTGWNYGADTAYLRELIDYWQREYDWAEQQRALNRFEHYRATVDGTRIHFVHAKSRDPNAIPVLLLHGWPSSFVQMLELIPLLTDPAARSASLPGFGFSDVPTRPGVGFATSAELMAKVMHDALGYERYGVRGSDLGGVIVRQMALKHPEQVIGVHLTGIIGAGGGAPPFTPAEQTFIDAVARVEPELAYARLQMSKPQTLAHALNDSPVGLAAWIVEKFRAWGDTNGDVESRFSKDELITNLMLYWVTGTAPASVRMYYDFVREPLVPGRVERPVGMLMSTKDLFPAAPREFGERLLNVQHWVETDVGGHFLEWEEPELVARDMQTFFGALQR
jgi:pimeloyl-ACP methyl ester carboxylesterase